MNRQMLKGKLCEKGKTYRDLAALLHKSVTTVSIVNDKNNFI